MLHVGLQGRQHRVGVVPALGRQNLGALGQQHGGLPLHLGVVLQVFNAFDAFGQLHLDAGQGLFGQRCARFGGIALPGHGIGNIELAQCQEGLRLLRPLDTHGFLAFGALQLVQLFTQGFDRAFVTGAQLFEDVLHLLHAGVGGQPVTHARGPVTRSRGGKSTTRQGIQGVGIGRFGIHGGSHLVLRSRGGRCRFRRRWRCDFRSKETQHVLYIVSVSPHPLRSRPWAQGINAVKGVYFRWVLCAIRAQSVNLMKISSDIAHLHRIFHQKTFSNRNK